MVRSSAVTVGMLGILVTPAVPDTSLLDRRLVQLLASQRLHQLFGHCHGDEKTTGAPPHEPNHSVGKGINGIHSVLFPQLAKPTPTPGNYLFREEERELRQTDTR